MLCFSTRVSWVASKGLVKFVIQINTIVFNHIWRYNVVMSFSRKRTLPKLKSAVTCNLTYFSFVLDNSDEDCVICMVNPKERICLSPCGHASFCRACIKAISSKANPICPMCRSLIERTQEIYEWKITFVKNILIHLLFLKFHSEQNRNFVRVADELFRTQPWGYASSWGGGGYAKI